MITLLVFIDDARHWRNSWALRLREQVLKRLESDPRLQVIRCSIAERLPSTFAQWAVNLSSSPTAQLVRTPGGTAGQITGVFDLVVREAGDVTITLPTLAHTPWVRPGLASVKLGAVLAAELWYSAYGASWSAHVGSWEGRAHTKSARVTGGALYRGVYLLFDQLWEHLSTNTTLERYSVWKSRTLEEVVPSPFAGALAISRHILAYAIKTLGNRFRAPTTVQWAIGLSRVDVLGRRDVSSVVWTEPPPTGFHADPFLIENEGALWVFFESLEFRNKKGCLVAAPVLADGSIDINTLQPVMVRNHHLSFPFLFRDGVDLYMIPEEASTGHVTLYRCANFPGNWVPHATILEDVSASDPVLFRHDDHYYLFLSDATDGNHDNNLLLFCSTSLEGPYRRHPASPVRLGLGGSRMGGAIVPNGDRLIRLGQNCERSYGGSLLAFEVLTLTPTDYREAQLFSLMPAANSSFAHGLHTLSQADGWTAIDGYRHLPLSAVEHH